MKNKHKEILDLLTYQYGNDWKSKPFSIGNKSGATNGYALAVIPCKTDFEDQSAKTRVVYPFEKNLEKTISVEVIKKVLSKFPLIDNYDEVVKECDCCEGSGFVYAEYRYNFQDFDFEVECPICNGDGQETTRSTTPNGTKSIDRNKLVMIGELAFHIDRIEEMINTANIVGVEEVVIVNSSKSSYGFQIGDVEVLSMGSTYSNDDQIGATISL